MGNVVDNFPQADEDPLSGGGAWGSFSGLTTFQVISNFVEVSFPNDANTRAFAVYVGQDFATDQFAKVIFASFTGSVDPCSAGAIVRSDDPPSVNFYLAHGFNPSVGITTVIGFHDIDGYHFLAFDDGSVPWQDGDEFMFSAVGNSPTILTVYRNGVQALQTSDSTLVSGRIGMEAAASTITDIKIGSFIGSDIGLSITPSVGSLTTTAIAPNRFRGNPRLITSGSVVFTVSAPILTRYAPLPATAILSFTGVSTIRVQSTVKTPTVGALAMAGAFVNTNRATTIPAGSLSGNGVAPVCSQSLLMSLATAQLTFVGLATGGVQCVPVTGTLTVTGGSILGLRSVLTAVGSLSLTGVTSVIFQSLCITPSTVGLNFTGPAPRIADRIGPDAGVITATGSQVISLEQDFLFPSSVSLSIVGKAPMLADLVSVPACGSMSITASVPVSSSLVKPNVGVMSIVGNTLVPFGTCQTSTGILAIAGLTPRLAIVAVLPAVGSLTLSGKVSVQDNTRIPSSVSMAVTGATPAPVFMPNTAILSILSDFPNQGAAIKPLVGTLSFILSSSKLDKAIRTAQGALTFVSIGQFINTSHRVQPNSGVLLISGVQTGVRGGSSLDVRIVSVSGTHKYIYSTSVDTGNMSVVVTHNLNDANAVLAGDCPQWPWMTSVRVAAKTANTMTLEFNVEAGV